MRTKAAKTVNLRPQARCGDAMPLAVVRRLAYIRRRLLGWYDRHRRDLPWRRRQADAYAQWVAEIMLQQTRVETAIDYYERFMRRFPSVTRLARARHDTVLKHWEGLGYYRRALHLHEAARLLQRQGRRLPRTAREWRLLPGVGDYTASAIASIAFGERAAAVDGNVVRVIARLFGLQEDSRSSAGKRKVQELANRLLPVARPGDFNQAWMDLGSAVCTPRSPRCDVCPLARGCVASATNQTHSLPRRSTAMRRAKRTIASVACIFVWNGLLLLHRRPRGGLWSGLWEFPHAELSDASPASVLQRTALDDHALMLMGRPRRAGTIVHELTHITWTFHVFIARVQPVENTPVRSATRGWFHPSDLKKRSLSTAAHRILATGRCAIQRDGADQRHGVDKRPR